MGGFRVALLLLDQRSSPNDASFTLRSLEILDLRRCHAGGEVARTTIALPEDDDCTENSSDQQQPSGQDEGQHIHGSPAAEGRTAVRWQIHPRRSTYLSRLRPARMTSVLLSRPAKLAAHLACKPDSRSCRRGTRRPRGRRARSLRLRQALRRKSRSLTTPAGAIAKVFLLCNKDGGCVTAITDKPVSL
jgi:hypothetical protein